MKFVDSWYWPDGEQHMLEWIAEPRNRMILNDRPAYQGKKQLAARDLLKVKSPLTMIDAGAHVGLWSYNFAKWGHVVFAFEPVAEHRDCWRKNMTDVEFATLYPYALGDKADRVNIRVNPTSTGDSWVKGKGEIEQRTIDSMEIPNVDFIKIDAEGYEEFILRGAINTLRANKPLVCVEQKGDMPTKFGLKPQGAVEFLKSLGYRVVREIGGDYLMVAK